MKGRPATAAEKEWMNRVADLNCIVCRNERLGSSPAEIHHVYGKVKEGAHFEVLPLCFLHHNARNDTEQYTSRHPYKKRFEQRYGTEQQLLKQVKELLNEY